MVSAAFDCSASLPACWLGLMGLGVAPAVHACGLLLAQRLSRRRQHQPGDAPKEDATSESKLDGRGSTSSQQPLLPAADEQQWCGVVKEGAWRGLFLREAQVVLHIGFQLFMLLPLLGALVAPSSTGRAGDYWWWHILAARLLAGAAWAALLVLEERAHTDPDAGRVHRQIGGDTTRYYRLPAGIAGFYVVAFVGATAALLAMVARSEGEWRWDVGDVELWDLVLVVGLICPTAFVAALRPTKARVLTEGFSPELNTGLSAWALFSWMQPLFAAAKKAQARDPSGAALDPHRDIYPPPRDRRAGAASDRLLELRRQHPKDSLWTSVFRLVAREYLQQFVWRLLSSSAVFVAPLALRRLLAEVGTYLSQREAAGGEAPPIPTTMWLCVLGLFLGPALNAVGDTQAWALGRRMGTTCRGALSSLVMRKALRLDVLSSSSSSDGAPGGGELANLLAVDAQSVLELMVFSHMITGGIEVLLLSLALLFSFLGLSALAGLALIALTVPLNAWLQKRMKWLQGCIMERKDMRMRRISEALCGIQVCKLFAWEPDFAAAIDGLRELELAALKSYLMLMSASTVILRGSPTLVALATFLVRVKVEKRPLEPAAAFAALSLFNLLRFPLIAMPEAFHHLIQARISFRRIERFLQRTECPGRRGLPSSSPLDEATAACTIVGGSFGYSYHSAPAAAADDDSDDDGSLRTPLLRSPSEEEEEGAGTRATEAVLKGVDLVIPARELTVVYGPTGAGKTTLLLALLGEAVPVAGGCQLSPSSGSRVAYVSQRPWILNSTLRDNILFGAPFDPERYWAVIAACALGPDLQLMPAGDMQEIGEKGVNLSGGQQQRVNLARALYSDAPIVLMDDVLSAVDAPVAEHMYKQAILRFLKGRTRVLVTHQTALTLPGAAHAVLVEKGRVTYQGPPSDAPPLLAPLSLALAAGAAHVPASPTMDEEGEETKNGEEAAALFRQYGGNVNGHATTSVGRRGRITANEVAVSAAAAAAAAGEQGAGETRWRGLGRRLRVAMRAYEGYFRASGWATAVLLLPVFTLGFAGLNVAQSILLKDWIRTMQREGRQNGGAVDAAMAAFALTCAGALSCLVLRAWTVEGASIVASRRLHRSLLDRVLRAPMGWYDATPMGRVFNRFSHDFQTIDKEVMAAIVRFGDMCLSLVAVVAVVLLTIPYMALALAVILPLAFGVARTFLALSTPLKRLEAAARSPLYAHFTESIAGLVVLRAYRAEPLFLSRLHHDVDEADRMHFVMWIANYYMSMRLRLLGATVAGVTALAVVLKAAAGGIDAATAGLALTYALPFSQAVVFSLRTHAELELHIGSVERVLEYLGIAQEAPAIQPGYRPSEDRWPSQGEVTVEGLVVRYRSDLDPVLKKLSFHVPPRTKVGICGRTGSGKSTLLLTLFRMVEPEAGRVVIDGLDTGRMGLADLRSRIAVIPQEPTLFQGTIRSNLDRRGQHADAELWDALRRVHLSSSVTSLEQEVADGGANLSVGERQLLCFARALLKRAAVVIMDEATANVDPVTDARIQELIRSCLGDTTVLCIAHRLATVAYYDRVLVLNKGELQEYDTPFALLQRPGSRLRSMAERTGDLPNLIAIAQEAAAAAAKPHDDGHGQEGPLQ